MDLSFIHVLTLIFITLKLIGVITWSWWLVLLPAIIYIVVRSIIEAIHEEA